MRNDLPFTHSPDSGLFDLVGSLHGANLIVVEIGSLAGGSAEVFLSSSQVAKVYCIDPWLNGYDPADPTSQWASSCEATFDNRMSSYPSDRFEKVKALSQEALSLSSIASLQGLVDVLYIDGDHRYEAVRQDILSFTPLLKTGGVLAGHDYTDNTDHPHILGVRRAVDELVTVERVFSDTSWAVYNWSPNKLRGWL